jgi:hypothetical protein
MFGTRFKRVISAVLVMSMICIMFASCSNQPADLLFRCSDIMGNNEKYYSVTGDQLQEISAFFYYNPVGGSMSDYVKVEQTYMYLFEVKTNGSALSEWEYEQSIDDPKAYDQELLINELDKLNVSGLNVTSVLIYEFDEYKTIQVAYIDGTSYFYSTALLYKENMIDIPDGVELDLFREAYIHK